MNTPLRMLNRNIRNNYKKLYEKNINQYKYPYIYEKFISGFSLSGHLPISESFKKIPYDEQYETHDFKLNQTK